MINPGGYFLLLLLLFIQISFEHDKDIGLLEVDVNLLEGEEATAFPLLGCHLIQHTLAFMWGLLCSCQIQTAVESSTLLMFNYLTPSDPQSAVRHLELAIYLFILFIYFIYLFWFTVSAQANVVLM